VYPIGLSDEGRRLVGHHITFHRGSTIKLTFQLQASMCFERWLKLQA
jgi:hypothetical protein